MTAYNDPIALDDYFTSMGEDVDFPACRGRGVKPKLSIANSPVWSRAR